MMCDPMIEVVLVHVGIHPGPVLPQYLVVLRSGKWREKEQFEDVKRQLTLDDLDVAQNRRFAVTGKTDDVASACDSSVLAPFLHHLWVMGDLVLTLFRSNQIVRIDVFEPDEDPADACLRRFLDEIRNFMAKGIDLDRKADLWKIAGAQRY